MNALIEHVQQNLAIYAVGGTAFLVVFYIFRAKLVPIFYHFVEYLIYCVSTHFVLGGVVRLLSWFRAETSFQAVGDRETHSSFTTPLSMDFWRMELYAPQWVFFLEIAIAIGFLYVVMVIRPTRFKHNPYREKNRKQDEKRHKALKDKLATEGTQGNPLDRLPD